MSIEAKKTELPDLLNFRRELGPLAQMTRVFRLDVRRELKRRKFLIQLMIQFIPVVVVLADYMLSSQGWMSQASLKTFTADVTVRILVPFASLFYSAPIISDELEGRTLTYLTLRPVDRGAIYLGKLLAAIFMTHVVTLIPFIAFAGLTFLLYGNYYENFLWLSKGFAAVAGGSYAYCAVFAAMGTLFRSGILASMIFYLVVEVIVPALPVLNLASISTHLGTLVDSTAESPFSQLTSVLVNDFISITASASLAIVLIYALFWTIAGGVVFRNKQYVI